MSKIKETVKEIQKRDILINNYMTLYNVLSSSIEPVIYSSEDMTTKISASEGKNGFKLQTYHLEQNIQETMQNLEALAYQLKQINRSIKNTEVSNGKIKLKDILEEMAYLSGVDMNLWHFDYELVELHKAGKDNVIYGDIDLKVSTRDLEDSYPFDYTFTIPFRLDTALLANKNANLNSLNHLVCNASLLLNKIEESELLLEYGDLLKTSGSPDLLVEAIDNIIKRMDKENNHPLKRI